MKKMVDPPLFTQKLWRTLQTGGEKVKEISLTQHNEQP
jgi:hypothetical protein